MVEYGFQCDSYQPISIAALLTPKRQCCVMNQKSNFQSLISFTKYLRDTEEEIIVSNHLPQGLIPKALSLFTVYCYRPRISPLNFGPDKTLMYYVDLMFSQITGKLHDILL